MTSIISSSDPSLSSSAIGHRIQIFRKKRGLTQKDLADKIGLTREAVNSYESGRVHLSDLVLINIALALRISSDEILGLKSHIHDDPPVSRRLMKRMASIDALPEQTKKHIIKLIDDSIKANSPS